MDCPIKTVKSNFYNYSLCHLCKHPKPDLKRCSNCKLLYYCSREHQQLDWSTHKPICNAIVEMNKYLCFPENATPFEMTCFKLLQIHIMATVLERPLSLYESQMFMFPKICKVCQSRDATVICEKCWSVAYCSESHRESDREKHDKCCETLDLCLRYEKQCHTLQRQYKLHFKCKKSSIEMLPKTMEELFKVLDLAIPEIPDPNLQLLMLSDLFSHIATIICGLEKCKFLEKRRGKRTKLVIHIVKGSLTYGMNNWLRLADALAHWVTNLQKIQICVVTLEGGPCEVNSFPSCCEELKRRRVTVTCATMSGMYKEWVGKIPRPDLVALFNTGPPHDQHFIFRNNLQKMVSHKGVPVVATASNEREMEKTMAQLAPMPLKYFVKPQANPYGSRRPVKNFEEGMEPISYANHYVAIFAKK